MWVAAHRASGARRRRRTALTSRVKVVVRVELAQLFSLDPCPVGGRTCAKRDGLGRAAADRLDVFLDSLGLRDAPKEPVDVEQLRVAVRERRPSRECKYVCKHRQVQPLPGLGHHFTRYLEDKSDDILKEGGHVDEDRPIGGRHID